MLEQVYVGPEEAWGPNDVAQLPRTQDRPHCGAKVPAELRLVKSAVQMRLGKVSSPPKRAERGKNSRDAKVEWSKAKGKPFHN